MAKSKKIESKQRVELRIDPDLYALIEATSNDAGISINQLVQGVLWWAMPRASAGRVKDGKGSDAGPCVWFGPTDDELAKHGEKFDPQRDILFELDFSDRRAVVPGNAKGGRHG